MSAPRLAVTSSSSAATSPAAPPPASATSSAAASVAAAALAASASSPAGTGKAPLPLISERRLALLSSIAPLSAEQLVTVIDAPAPGSTARLTSSSSSSSPPAAPAAESEEARTKRIASLPKRERILALCAQSQEYVDSLRLSSPTWVHRKGVSEGVYPKRYSVNRKAHSVLETKKTIGRKCGDLARSHFDIKMAIALLKLAGDAEIEFRKSWESCKSEAEKAHLFELTAHRRNGIGDCITHGKFAIEFLNDKVGDIPLSIHEIRWLSRRTSFVQVCVHAVVVIGNPGDPDCRIFDPFYSKTFLYSQRDEHLQYWDGVDPNGDPIAPLVASNKGLYMEERWRRPISGSSGSPAPAPSSSSSSSSGSSGST